MFSKSSVLNVFEIDIADIFGLGNKECVQELLGAGASCELRDKGGYSALKVAEEQGHAATAELLRQYAAK